MLKQQEVRENFVGAVKEELGLELTSKQAESIIKIIDAVRYQDLLETGKTKLPGVGNLEIRYRAGRPGVNPKTKEPIEIAEALTVGLSASKTIKDDLAENVDIAPYRKEVKTEA